MRREFSLSRPCCLRFLLTQTLLEVKKASQKEEKKNITEKPDVEKETKRRRQGGEGTGL